MPQKPVASTRTIWLKRASWGGYKPQDTLPGDIGVEDAEKDMLEPQDTLPGSPRIPGDAEFGIRTASLLGVRQNLAKVPSELLCDSSPQAPTSLMPVSCFFSLG